MTNSHTEQFSVQQSDLDGAVEAGIITGAQRDALWLWLRQSSASSARSRFDMAHLLWYLGALIVMGAMGFFATLAFSTWGGPALILTSLSYALIFIVLGQQLWQRGLQVPGGLAITVAVSMVPLFVFGVQETLGWWQADGPGAYRDFYHKIRSGWLPMEVATLFTGVLAVYFYRFAFLITPVAVALWFMSMDLVPVIYGDDWNQWEQRKIVSLWFGLGMLAAAWIVDIRAREHYAFWLHLFGLMTFWCGLTLLESDSELSKAVYCAINVVLLFLALFLQRRAYSVFGGLGVAVYLYDLADRVFADSLLFPFALSLIGLAILAIGVIYHRKQAGIQAAFQRRLPAWSQALRPPHAKMALSR